MPNDTIIHILKKELKRVEESLHKINETIDHFTDPFPCPEDFPDYLSYLKARDKHIHNHLYGKYSRGKIEKLYDKKLELEIEKLGPGSNQSISQSSRSKGIDFFCKLSS